MCSSPAYSAPASSLVEGNTAFAIDFYNRVKAAPGNLFFSPYSISTCLAMTYAGARGETESQMGQVLHFAKDQAQVHAGFAELQRRLNEAEQQKGIELSVANALWSQKDHSFTPDFLNIAKGEYQANVAQADFKTGADEARLEINRWVTQKTKDKIKDILPAGSLTAHTRLVLADAVYFKGAWTRPFEKTGTTSQRFHISATDTVDAQVMHHVDTVKYLETDSFQAVELPYGSDAFSMVVVLPRDIGGLPQLEATLSTTTLSAWLGQLKMQKVEIFLPRFKMETSLSLAPELGQMGMPDAFGPKADFSGIDGAKDLFISAVLHKAWVEVNEEGTEAAAATTTVMTMNAIRKPTPPPVFRADHPFLFLIRDTRSGSMLFIGRLMNPAQ
jgi:serpin B